MMKTKRNYSAPKLEIELFTANHYIAACSDKTGGVTYKFECNAGESYKQYAIHDASHNVATISGSYMDGGHRGFYYHPCNQTHEASTDETFLTGYHLDDSRTNEDENISVIIWTDNNTDVHCTTNLNQSTWEKNHS